MSSFFFQAEDGIRDLTVTGVQTCALPIYDPQAIAAVREHAKTKLKKILLEVETRLGDSSYALGSQFSVADAYLFVFYLWSFDERIQAELPARPRYAAHAARVWDRPAVRRVVAREHAVRVYALPPELAAELA